MGWRGPRYEGELPSLGWQVLTWGHAYLPSPSDSDKPLTLTDEQARHVVDWYTLDPKTGVFIYRRDVIERAKGWGKSPLVGFLSLAEFGAADDIDAAPVIFDGWDAEGEPVGRPWGTKGSPPSWIQIAAVSEDQTDNTYGAIYELLTANDHKAAKSLGIDDGRTRLYLHGRPGQLEPVTASAGSREGQRVTFAVLDETHLWTARNGGVRLAKTIRRNAAKMSGRTIETTNAPRIGEKSVAERSGTEADRGFAGILHYTKRPAQEPQPDWSDADLLAALDESYGDSYWIDRQRILKEIRDPSTDWDDALQFFFNIRTVGTGHAVDPRRWDELAKPRDIPANTPIGLGFDGSISEDETWLVACTADGYSWKLGRWNRPKNVEGWTVPRSEVNEAVANAFARFRVGRMFYDPPKWWSEGEQWASKYGKEVVLALDTNQARRFAPAVDRWRTAIREGTHTHDSDPALAEHVKASHLKKVKLTDAEDDGRTRYVIVKGEDRRKIDGAVADILALEAAMSMPEPPAVVVPAFISADDED
jgi:hypothetical protein